MINESMMNAESTVMDGSFYQPMESTRLTRSVANWSPSAGNVRGSKAMTKPEQQLYKLYGQALADSEVTQDWNSWVEMMMINCQKCCAEAEISQQIAYRLGRQPQTHRMLQIERDCWLLWHRARDALNNTCENLPDVIPGSSHRLMVEHQMLKKPELRMARAVQGWLQTIRSDEQFQTELKMSMAKLQPKRIYWEKTFHHLKSSYNSKIPNPFVTCLDFDATHREKRRLCDTDEKEEHDLLQIVFSLLRVGEFGKAKNLCRSTGYHWLAAILSANELYHDENYYSSESTEIIYPVEGNKKRIQWTETMYDLCMDVRLSLYERAIYGLLCGRIEALTPVCKNYNDFLWAYISCYIEQEIYSILTSTNDDGSKEMMDDLSSVRPIHRDHPLSIDSIFQSLLTCSDEIAREATFPFHQIQKFLILADYENLFRNIFTFVNRQDSTSSLLRFSTHICLFLFEQNRSNEFDENMFVEILSVYIRHLIELDLKDLVCYYISKLPNIHQSKVMASFLDNLSNQDDREFYLKQAFTFKIDIDQSLLILAANQQTEQVFQRDAASETISTGTKPLTENDQKQIEALKLLTTFLSTQTLDALRFANRLCRYFLHEMKYEGIRLALSLFPHDIDIHTIEANNREQSVDDLREFKAIGAFIAALEAGQHWSEIHQKQSKTEERTYLPIVIQAFYQVFDYPQGWLVDMTSIHETMLDNQQRSNEMAILRQKVIPMLACQLFRIFDLVEEEQETFRLLVFLSDHRQQKLYSLFSKESLNTILSLTEKAVERCLDRSSSDGAGKTVPYFL